MVTVYALKPRFQRLLRPLVGRLARAGVTANQVTVAAAVGSLAVGALVASLAALRPLFLLFAAWLLVRMALNAIDGMLAREFGQESRLGGYLNELGDMISDAALYAPFALVAPFGPGWVGAVIVLAARAPAFSAGPWAPRAAMTAPSARATGPYCLGCWGSRSPSPARCRAGGSG